MVCLWIPCATFPLCRTSEWIPSFPFQIMMVRKYEQMCLTNLLQSYTVTWVQLFNPSSRFKLRLMLPDKGLQDRGRSLVLDVSWYDIVPSSHGLFDDSLYCFTVGFQIIIFEGPPKITKLHPWIRHRFVEVWMSRDFVAFSQCTHFWTRISWEYVRF